MASLNEFIDYSNLLRHLDVNVQNWEVISSLQKGEVISEDKKVPIETRFKKINQESLVWSGVRLFSDRILHKDLALWKSETEPLKGLQYEIESTENHVKIIKKELSLNPNVSPHVLMVAIETLDNLKATLFKAADEGYAALIKTYDGRLYLQPLNTEVPQVSIPNVLKNERDYIINSLIPDVDQSIVNLGRRLQTDLDQKGYFLQKKVGFFDGTPRGKTAGPELDAAFQNFEIDNLSENSNFNSNSNSQEYVDADFEAKLRETAKKNSDVDGKQIKTEDLIRELIQQDTADSKLEPVKTPTGGVVMLPHGFILDVSRQTTKINGKEQFTSKKKSFLNSNNVWENLHATCILNRTSAEGGMIGERIARLAFQALYADMYINILLSLKNDDNLPLYLDTPEHSMDLIINETTVKIVVLACFDIKNTEDMKLNYEAILAKRVIEIPIQDLLVSERDLTTNPLPGVKVIDTYSKPLFNKSFAISLMDTF